MTLQKIPNLNLDSTHFRLDNFVLRVFHGTGTNSKINQCWFNMNHFETFYKNKRRLAVCGEKVDKFPN